MYVTVRFTLLYDDDDDGMKFQYIPGKGAFVKKKVDKGPYPKKIKIMPDRKIKIMPVACYRGPFRCDRG